MRYNDIVGASDILGNELADLLSGDELVFGADPIAAAAPLASAGSATKLAMLRQLAMKNGSAVVERAPTKSRRYSQGFGPTVIAAGATVNIIVQPQVTFKGTRLVIPSDFAGAVSVNDLKIGNTSQLPSSNPLPGRAFTEFAVGMEQEFDTAQISQQISLSVTNTSGAPITFSALLNGKVVM